MDMLQRALHELGLRLLGVLYEDESLYIVRATGCGFIYPALRVHRLFDGATNQYLLEVEEP